jgi:GntR family transcriptional regulator/MocR family aminotransferase
VTTQLSKSGTSFGPELLIHLRDGRRRAQLEERLRELVREGVLPAGTRLPSSRALAGDLSVSRRLVVDAYAQLHAEGYLVARQGAGTYVASTGSVADGLAAAPPVPQLSFDFFPGAPDLASFPRALWLRALRDVLRSAPPAAFAYPDARGALPLRLALAAYLRRVRGVVVEPSSIVICAGATQGLTVLGRALSRDGLGEIAVEDPGLPPHRAVLSYAGLKVRGAPVDEEGVDVHGVSAPVVLATPAHQCPTGVVLSPRRRAALIGWARGGGLVIEDDYDAEFRYDRDPVGALQGLAPERVALIGTVSKSIAPALRLGWVVCPARLLDAVTEEKRLSDRGSPGLEQLALARLVESGRFDRHLRHMRRVYAARRDVLVGSLRHRAPEVGLEGLAAGFHAVARLREDADEDAIVAEARARSIGLYGMSMYRLRDREGPPQLVLGFGNLTEPAIERGIATIADLL